MPMRFIPSSIQYVFRSINPLDKYRHYSIKSTINVWLFALAICALCVLVARGVGADSWYQSTLWEADYNELISNLISTLVTIVVSSFTLMIVALQLASQQFSPRIMRIFFAGDAVVQGFLGIYVGTILYCYSIKSLGIAESVLNIPVGIALLFGFLCLLIFPLFIVYYVDNINAASITQKIKQRVLHEAHLLYPTPWTDQLSNICYKRHHTDGLSINVLSPIASGYLDELNAVRLQQLFQQYQQANPNLGIIALQQKPIIGEFVCYDTTILLVVEVSKTLDAAQINKITLDFQHIAQQVFTITKYRSISQDINFGLRQLVDMGIKAISPAVNDPTTCVNCIDNLGEIIRQLADKEFPSATARQLETQHIYINEFNFAEMLDLAFNQIFQWGKNDPIIVKRLVNTIGNIILHVENPYHLSLLIQEVEEMELDFVNLTKTVMTDAQRERFHTESRESVRKELHRFHETMVQQLQKLESAGIFTKYEKLYQTGDPRGQHTALRAISYCREMLQKKY